MKAASIRRAPVHIGRASHALRTLMCLGGCALLVAGCSSLRGPTVPPAPLPSGAGTGRMVTASWYGEEASGRRTANGEIFDPEKMTAASRSLPIGSRVRVTNVTNGRSVVVRINDRGPYVRGRNIDLSHGAAQRIGLTRAGVGRVQVERADGYETPKFSSRPERYAAAGSSLLPVSEPATTRRRVHRSRWRHRRSRSRIVGNPLGDWIASALWHF